MKKITTILLAGWLAITLNGQDMPWLRISENQRYIITAEGDPFFWLGGTAWELIHRLNREEMQTYLSDRAGKGFTVIQTVILAELDGLNTPNAYGDRPLRDNDPEKLNEAYFDLVDDLVQRSEALGLYVALLPTWGDKFNKRWGAGPEIFTPENAEQYGRLIASRYLSHPNIIWVLGGDRIPEKEVHFDIIRAMAKGIRSVDTLHLMTYHPVGGRKATDFFNDPWLDLDMFQSGHSRVATEYRFVLQSREQTPVRPVINGEARYENIPDRFWEEKTYGWLDDADVRVSAYWSILSGAAGYTYGCNDIWQMYEINRDPVISARTGWKAAIHLPGSTQMGYMKKAFEQVPWQTMQYDPSLVLNENPENESFRMAAMGESGTFMLAYTPTGEPVKLDLSGMKSGSVHGYWFNPRSGRFKYLGNFDTRQAREFRPWSEGRGSDFLLLLTENEISGITQ